MPRSRYRVFENEFPYFLTCSVVGWLPVFSRPDAVNILLGSWRYLAENGRIALYGYVIMENHLHLIASSQNLSKEIGDFKSFSARKIIDMLKDRNAGNLLDQMKWHRAAYRPDREYQLWQEGSHPQQIQSDEMMLQKLDYFHLNPVRRGYVED